MENNTKELTDGIIYLKPFELEDAPLHLAGEDVEQQKWISGGKSTLGSIENWIKKNQEYWKNGGPIFNFAIWADEKLVGIVEANLDVQKVEGIEEGQTNISYGIYPQFRRKGYAARAVNLLLSFLKLKGVKEAIIRVDRNNANGLRIPEECGFRENEEIKDRDSNILKLFVKEL